LVDVVSTLVDLLSNMPDINSRIAGRVRSLRAELGLSLEALASRCAVSRSMLSLVERGEASPTAVLLEKIATGLGCSLASLFDDTSASAGPVSHAADRTAWKDPQSGYVRRNISPANFPSPIRIVDVTFPAGAKFHTKRARASPQSRSRSGCETVPIEVTVGKLTHKLAKDDCLAMLLDAPSRSATARAGRRITSWSSRYEWFHRSAVAHSEHARVLRPM
jgi:transcriptional regulator with XRE-family HTH domain